MYSLMRSYKESLPPRQRKVSLPATLEALWMCLFPNSMHSSKQDNHYPDFYSNHFFVFLYSFYHPSVHPQTVTLVCYNFSKSLFINRFFLHAPSPPTIHLLELGVVNLQFSPHMDLTDGTLIVQFNALVCPLYVLQIGRTSGSRSLIRPHLVPLAKLQKVVCQQLLIINAQVYLFTECCKIYVPLFGCFYKETILLSTLFYPIHM